MSTLYLVATPIGNLEDISARALRVLREVRLIAAEDTRHTGKLLQHFGIRTRLISYYEHNKFQQLDSILNALNEGDVAVVSDAGTPGLNDPGYRLVQAALAEGHEVSPIPGPSAPIAALVASGLPTDRFLYLGYLPRKPGERRRAAEAVRQLPYTLIFLESPHRVLSALEDLLAVLGDRQIAVGREITKLYEEFFRGTLSEAVAFFQQAPARGEITLVVAGAPPNARQWPPAQVEEALQAGLARGEPPSQLAKQVASQAGWPRREVYNLITRLQKEKPPHH